MQSSSENSLTQFCSSALNEDLEACDQRLRAGLDPNSTISVSASENEPLLFFAAHTDLGNELVSALLSHGASPDGRTYTGDMLLHELCGSGVQRLAHVDMARTLVQSGADINALDRNGMTPLDRAIAMTRAMLGHPRERRHEHPDLLVSRFLIDFLEANGGRATKAASAVMREEIRKLFSQETLAR